MTSCSMTSCSAGSRSMTTSSSSKDRGRFPSRINPSRMLSLPLYELFARVLEVSSLFSFAISSPPGRKCGGRHAASVQSPGHAQRGPTRQNDDRLSAQYATDAEVTHPPATGRTVRSDRPACCALSPGGAKATQSNAPTMPAIPTPSETSAMTASVRPGFVCASVQSGEQPPLRSLSCFRAARPK